MRLPLLHSCLLAACLATRVEAFFEGTGRGGSLFGKGDKTTYRDGYASSVYMWKKKDAETATTTTTTTRLLASRQFRDVEDMLDSFREDLVLINFMAINCGPCRLQKKELSTVSQALGGGLQLLAIDTNRWPTVSSRFEVGKLPCLLALKDGQVLFRIEGFTKAEDVVERVRSVQEQYQSVQ